MGATGTAIMEWFATDAAATTTTAAVADTAATATVAETATAASAAAMAGEAAAVSTPLWGTGAAVVGGGGATAAGVGATLAGKALTTFGPSLAQNLLQKKPSAPSVAPVTAMPDPMAQAEAKRQAMIEQLARRGRSSTILTDSGSGGKLGG